MGFNTLNVNRRNTFIHPAYNLSILITYQTLFLSRASYQSKAFHSHLCFVNLHSGLYYCAMKG